MIENVARTVTETGTTIDQQVELSQKGIIQIVPSVTGRHFVLPCNIPNPKVFTICPMTENAAIALGASSTEPVPWSDLILHYATGANVSAFASIASTVLEAEVGYRYRMDTASFALYVAAASQGATTAASNARLASNSLWKKVHTFGANQKKYLKVFVNQTASDVFQAKKIKFSYEIKGY